MRTLAALLALVLAALIVTSALGLGPLMVNREGQLRIAFLLGDPVAVVAKPGPALTWPFVRIDVFDGRWQHLPSEPREVSTLDQERIVIDHYVVWRIKDPLQFRTTFPAGMLEAQKQIDQQARGQLREVVGQKRLMQVLKSERQAIMTEITQRAAEAVKRFGVEIADVRLNRTELPRGTEENVYARMRAERERLARKHRAEGEEEARTIRAEADREAQVIVAEARRDAEVERGKGDAESARIYADAYSQDPDFYAFVRGLEAYRKTLGKGTTLVLPPDHEFFRLFQSGGELPPVATPPR
jgi:membrane protease subunit HflC